MKKIWKFLIANLDTIIAIVVSIFAAIFGVFGGNQIALLTGIATVLGLLAYGIIRDRSAREILGENINKLENAIQATSRGKTTAETFFIRRTNSPSLAEFLRTGTESLDILGNSLISVGTIHSNVLRDLKEKGGKVRIIVANPDNIALTDILSKRYKELDNASVAKNHINTTLTSLTPLIGRLRNGGSLAIKLTDFDPTFSYIGVDIKKLTGKSQIEFPLNRTGVGQNPIFILDAINDANWFSEFNNQFELLWKLGRDVDELHET